jgi:hypothetical protein
MTTGFICDRCGARYGVLVKARPGHDRREDMQACVEGRCDVARSAVRWLYYWNLMRAVV